MQQQQQAMPPKQAASNPNAGGFGVPAAMTRGNNGQAAAAAAQSAQRAQEAATPLDEESRPYKPTQACYMSFDDFYG